MRVLSWQAVEAYTGKIFVLEGLADPVSSRKTKRASLAGPQFLGAITPKRPR